MGRNLMHLSGFPEIDLLILNELNGENLAKSGRIFYFIIFGSTRADEKKSRSSVRDWDFVRSRAPRLWREMACWPCWRALASWQIGCM
jgi:hypothetical protein